MKAAVCLLLALITAARAVPAGPGPTAVAFLEKVRERKIDLKPGGDTALSPQTADGKRTRIARQLDRLAGEIGAGPLEVGEVREDGDFAAALIRRTGGFDPAGLRVFPIALVKRDEKWAAAPVPASFENSGAGYAPELRKRLKELENWMLRGQVEELQQLREEARGALRRKIEAGISADRLRGMNAGEAVRAFLDACEKRDLPAALGLLGGLADELPVDWTLRLRATERAFSSGPDAPRGWRLLIAPEVVRVILFSVVGGLEVSVPVGCLDPRGENPATPVAAIRMIRLGIDKDAGGLWRIGLPQELLDPTAETSPFSEPVKGSDETFVKAWRAIHPATPQATAELARDVFDKTLRDGGLGDFLGLVRLDGPAKTARRACIEAAKLWWSIHDPASLRRNIPLSFKAGDADAAGFYQSFLARDAAGFAPNTLYFEKMADGWLWNAVPASELRATYLDWVSEERKSWESHWQEKLLAETPVATDLAKSAAPTEDEATRCVRDWLAATKKGDVRAALALIALLPGERAGSLALQNLGYEFNGERQRAGTPEIAGVWRAGPWAAVGMDIPQTEGAASHPLYVVLKTEKGPRLLLETDLFATEDRNRDYLNDASLDRLERAVSKEAADGLRALLGKYQAAVRDAAGKR